MFYFANGNSFASNSQGSLGNSASSIGGEQSLPSLYVRVLTVTQMSAAWDRF